ncbi:MAG: ABC transporter permease [Verrucomicrobiae bacterium]|nr:ABC transporter permease [Verrucomicrobiae bacterium]
MSYQTTIRARQHWLHLPVKEIADYRDLLFLLVRRDFVAKYKQTLLGPLWFIIQPLLTTLVFTVVFDRVAQISTDGIPSVLFYLCGLLGWTYFSQTFSTTSTTFVTNAPLFGKVYFPRLIVPLSVTISNLLAFALNLGIFLGFLAYFKLFTSAGDAVHPTTNILFLPLLIIQLAATALGVGLWVSALTAKYRDLTHLSAFLVQLLMYATPVIYPLSRIPTDWQWLPALNPMTMIVENFRLMFLGQATASAALTLLSISVSIILFIAGIVLFQKTERTFIDTV